MPIEKAKISVFDHGFIYGDSVFETFRTYWGHPFQLNDHLKRLQRSAAGLELPLPHSQNKLRSIVLDSANAYWKRFGKKDELYIRVIVSRGYGDIGFDPALCPHSSLIIIIKKFTPMSQTTYHQGIPVAIVSTIRNSPRSLDPNIKSGNYLNNVLAYLEAKKRGAFEAIMTNHQGYITEGTVTNIFLVKDNALYTPSLDCGLLRGLTRSLVLKIARKEKIEVYETRINKSTLMHCDECFISSSLKAILPVQSCDAQKIGNGKPGPITRKLMALFKEETQKVIQEEYCIDL